jgi:cytochrome c biogenesis protein CcmG/thiol:disulfide interchange protein DsbE
METDKRFWYGLIAAAILLGGAWILASRVPGSQAGAAGAGLETAPRKGFLAPDFTLTALDGATVRLSDLRGKPVLINFWASWCGPCRAEMPHLQAVFEAHADDGLVVLGVNQLESPPAVARFVEEFGLTFPIPLDNEGNVSATYQARALPTSFFVDADGVIRDAFTGPMTGGLIESKLETILAKGAAGGGG